MTYPKIKIVVIEDERDARENLISRLNEEADISVVGSAASLNSGFLAIQENQPDAIFLDIQIKGGDAFNLINLLLREQIMVPPIILNTGFTQIEYAQKAFNEFKKYVVEIWLKPFYEGWDEKIEKAKYLIRNHHTYMPSPISITHDKYKVKSNGSIVILPVQYITHITSSGDLAKKRKSEIHLLLQPDCIVNKTLLQVTEDLYQYNFLRINRNQIINTALINRYDIQEQSLYLDHTDNIAFAVGNTYVRGLKNYLDRF
ncbi:MAG: two-component system LytT family response regulator [Saprospiraceae bacterium]|jgi:two-component system LytT family response regulator